MRMTTNQPQILEVARPKLAGIGDHVGLLILPNRVVAHNTLDRNAHISLYEQFAIGKPVRVVRQIPAALVPQTLQRIQHEVMNPMPYKGVTNNCETFVSRVSAQVPKSSQASFWLSVVGIGVLIAMAN